MEDVLAIIPARGGSKGLPDKNIRLLAGHPLIAYSIKAALDCPLISRVIVSTDSERIAEIAKSYGAEVPFMRPTEYAQDMSTDLEVFRHALEWLEKHKNYIPDLVVQLRPTSPARFNNDIENCITKLRNSGADSLRVVTTAFNNPFKMWIVEDQDQPMKPLLHLDVISEPYNQPRQNLPEIYWQTGTLDVIRTRVIREQKSMSGNTILPYLIEQKFALDIDDLDNFNRAEEMIRKYDCIKFLP
ncbi:acylneuraminate cytidylyltransferase family protein [Dyadobacter diqingensis]|uniref:acylneuraminate cytidylyltransferase family protein n=1 Tax=Dyadobacter diqingensis TaxID=2938121 RepID=UPI0020C19C02|nr:acylneuraminate cytidylyltransferase family protein [Dyadobacter diqingensis]